MTIDYNKIAGAIFKAWMKVCGVVMILYAIGLAIWVKWSDIKDWFDARIDWVKSKFNKTVDVSEMEN